MTRSLADGGRGVLPETLERVQQAVAELNYVPNRSAQLLRVPSSHLFGLTVLDVADPFSAAVASGAEDVAFEHGYTLVIADMRRDEMRQRQYLRNLIAERVAGIILASADRATEDVVDLARAHIPFVTLDRRLPNLALDTVTTNGADGASQAVRHLIDLGHVRIGIIGGPDSMSTLQERLTGAQRALAQAGLESMAQIRQGDGWESGGYEAMLDLLDSPQPPTAVLTCNSNTTIGALKAMRSRGVHMPTDMSLVGFDDLPMAELLDPPLTVVAQPTYVLGGQAVELLLRRIADRGAPAREVVLQPSLIIRGSTRRLTPAAAR